MTMHIRATVPPTMGVDVAGMLTLALSYGNAYHDRIDLVCGREVDPHMVEYVAIVGTPAVAPKPPPVPDDAVILAEVWVPSGASVVLPEHVRSFGWPR